MSDVCEHFKSVVYILLFVCCAAVFDTLCEQLNLSDSHKHRVVNIV